MEQRTGPCQTHSLALAFALLVLSAACASDSPAPAAGSTVRDSAGVQIVESSAPRGPDPVFAEVGAEPRLSIGLEDGDPNYLLHRVRDAHRSADGRTAIANSGTFEIRFYDASGRYINSVGRRGAGPGEFGELPSMRLHPHHDTLFATDDLRLNVDDLDAIERSLKDVNPIVPRRVTFYGADELIVREPCGNVVTFAHFAITGSLPR